MLKVNYLGGAMVMRDQQGHTTKFVMPPEKYGEAVAFLQKKYPDRPFIDETLPASMNPKEPKPQKVQAPVSYPVEILLGASMLHDRPVSNLVKTCGGKRKGGKIQGS